MFAAGSSSSGPKKVNSTTASGTDSSARSTDGGGTGSDSSALSTDSSALSTDSSGTTSESDVFTVGDTVEYDGVQVTLSSAIFSNGEEYNTPGDGKYFLGLVFDIDNQSSNDIAISSIASVEAYCDGYSLNEDITGFTAPEFDGMSQLDGSVASGKKMNGVIIYQVPADFSEFEISCTPDFWGTNKVTFRFTKDQADSSAVS